MEAEEKCEYCGRSKQYPRLTTKRLLSEFMNTTFSLEKGFFHTFWIMLKDPKLVLNHYLEGKRLPYTTPIKFLIVSITLSVILNWVISIENFTILQVNSDNNEDLFKTVFYENLERYYNVLLFAVIPIVALGSWLIFGVKKYNYAENLVIDAYIFGQINLLTFLLILLTLFLQLFGVEPGNLFAIGALGYLIYACMRFYQGKWYWKLLKSLGLFMFFFFGMLGLAFLLMFKMILSGEMEASQM